VKKKGKNVGRWSPSGGSRPTPRKHCDQPSYNVADAGGELCGGDSPHYSPPSVKGDNGTAVVDVENLSMDCMA